MPRAQRLPIVAVVFDLDGVLIDSEPLWERVREELTNETGGRWHASAQREMMGMSSAEWSKYMHEELGVLLAPSAISEEVVERLASRLRAEVPLLPGAREAVEALSKRWPLAIASSANRPVIDLVLELTGLAPCFRATVSSEEVARGKPAPDVYIEAARRLGADPGRCAAIEDSANGLRAARAAGMRVIAIPNATFPPGPAALELADVVRASLAELRPGAIEPSAGGARDAS
jgi:HAD superfamily hydrolase (TIGR01509 family)